MTLIARRACGNSAWAAVPSRSMTLIERDSVRPWPLPRRRVPGACAQGRRISACRRLRLIAFVGEQVMPAAGGQEVRMSALAMQRVTAFLDRALGPGGQQP